MIIRETRIIECWCDHCHEGQIKDLLQNSFFVATKDEYSKGKSNDDLGQFLTT